MNHVIDQDHETVDNDVDFVFVVTIQSNKIRFFIFFSFLFNYDAGNVDSRKR